MTQHSAPADPRVWRVVNRMAATGPRIPELTPIPVGSGTDSLAEVSTAVRRRNQT